ncbi:MAG: hypothetical protein LBP80_02960 [Treponema sp.]|jgi:hypothetical protein|nr:hypothetical protein [Treponema sp.]
MGAISVDQFQKAIGAAPAGETPAPPSHKKPVQEAEKYQFDERLENLIMDITKNMEFHLSKRIATRADYYRDIKRITLVLAAEFRKANYEYERETRILRRQRSELS